MSGRRSYSVEVELPVEGFGHQPWSPAEVAADLRLLWLVDQVRRRQIGSAKAAELAGLSQGAFARVLGVHHVSPFDLDADELDREIATGLSLGRP